MTEKTLKEFDSKEEVFTFKTSQTLYLIEATQKPKVFCVIIGGPEESLGEKITFQDHHVVTIPDTSILMRLDVGDKFVAENPILSGEYIFLELIQKNKNKWKCTEIYPKNEEKWRLSVTTPIFKVC